MKRLFNILTGILILASCGKELEPGTGSIYGKVTAFGLGMPIKDCTVSLQPSGHTTQTFEDGEFAFEDLQSGHYTITASRRGYQDKSALVKITAGSTTALEIKLESVTPYSLSESELNFGDLQESMSISMYNNSDAECTYSISDVPSWMTLTTKTGTIRGGSTAQIEATVDRSAIGYGKTTATLVFSFVGKVKMNLNVNASVEKVKLSAPTVTCSSSAAELKHTSFRITGTLNATGGEEVTEHGHCWSTSPSPTINNSRTRLGAKTSVGNFTSTITGLTASTKYYVRAYAVNAQGTSYSEQVEIMTSEIPLPTVTCSTSANNLKFSSFEINGRIEDTAETLITEHGHCWSTSPNPTISDYRTTLGEASSAYNFVSAISELEPNTLYYVRSYATNSFGTSYSEQVTIKTLQVPEPGVRLYDSPQNLRHTSFLISGAIDPAEDIAISNYGHCWSTSPEPTISNYRTTMTDISQISKFDSFITDLTPNTTYYVRAYATTSFGTYYSSTLTVNTLETYTDTWNGAIASSFSMGSGTATDPYVITTGGELQLVKNYPSACYVLGNNIDLNHHNWAPYDFSGSFDGKGYVISNLYISSSSNNLGLFSYLYAGTKVKNITLNGVNISAPNSNSVGAIAGYISSDVGYLENCKVILTDNSIIKGNTYVGGITGSVHQIYHTDDNVLLSCEVSSTSDSYVIVGNEKVGGIIGQGGCERCNVAADIKGGSKVGGICGYASAIVAHSSFKGKIEAVNAAGGIAGYSDQYVWIASCKADVDILVDNNSAGGILGDCYYHAKVASCYATGTVNASSSNSSYLGGLIGKAYYDVSIYDSYAIVSSSSNGFDGISGYYSSTSLIPSYCCTVFDTYHTKNDTKGYCTDITSHLRSANSTYSQFWNFDNTWTWTGTVNGKTVNVSCPRLLWE